MGETLGFIGLGKLGLPMATNLLNAGYALRVYNRTASKAETLLAQGAQLASCAADVVTRGGIVLSVVWDGDALESIVRSDDFLQRLGPGGIHLSMSTILPETAQRLADLHAHYGCSYVEAPIFGRPEAAQARQLWIPYAGPQAARERVRPLFQALGAQGSFDFGPEIGSATLVKLVGNFLIISAARSLREALTLSEKNGVDPQAVLDMLTRSLFPAPIYQSYGQRLAAGATTFTNQNAIPLKDLGFFQRTGQQVEMSTPLAGLLSNLLQGDIVEA